MLADRSPRLALLAMLFAGLAAGAPPKAPGRAAPSKTWFIPHFATTHHEHSAWSPTGTFALVRQQGDRALLFSAAQASPIAGLPILGEWQTAVWSRDGKRLAVTGAAMAPRITVLDLAELERPVTWAVVPSKDGDTPFPIGFLPDGKRVLVRVRSGALRVLDAGTGAAQGPELPVAERALMALAWSHPFLAHTLATGGFAITNVETGARVFSSGRSAQAMVWLTTAPKVAVKSDRFTFVWEPDKGLVELPGNGDATWDRRGDRIALFSPLGGSRSADDHDRCKECLRPVRWNGVFDLASRREVPTAGFLPDGKRHELLPYSLLDLETNVGRSLRPLPELPYARVYWIGEEALVTRGKLWDAKVELATGRTVAWAAQFQEPGWFFDPERRVACEKDRWAVRDRFTGTLLARLGDGTTCKDTSLQLLRSPLVAYRTQRETRIIDPSTNRTVVHLAGSPVDLNLHIDPSGERFAFKEKNHTLVMTLDTLTKAPWGPPGARATGWADARTLTLTTTAGSANLAVRDGVPIKETPRELEETPARPFAKGLAFTRRSPSGRFVAHGAPPAFILRTSDGAALRLIIIETAERPYSVLVDEQGRFSGDDEAARVLLYASGSSLADAKVHGALEVAQGFRQPKAIAAFFRR